MELIDASAIDDNTLQAMRDSNSKVELVFQWIQQETIFVFGDIWINIDIQLGRELRT